MHTCTLACMHMHTKISASAHLPLIHSLVLVHARISRAATYRNEQERKGSKKEEKKTTGLLHAIVPCTKDVSSEHGL